jgi:hypothetical protein
LALDRDRSMQQNKASAHHAHCRDNHVDRMIRQRHCARCDENEAAAFPRIIVPENFFVDQCEAARLM